MKLYFHFLFMDNSYYLYSLKEAYKYMLNSNYNKVRYILKQLVNSFVSSSFDKVLHQQTSTILYNTMPKNIYTTIYQAYMDVIFKRYNSAHNNLRDAYYIIFDTLL